MPFVHFTEDDRLDGVGVPHDYVALEEKATGCDGRVCGARPELVDEHGRSLENTPEYIAVYGSGIVPEHSHVISSRSHPGARRYVHKVF